MFWTALKAGRRGLSLLRNFILPFRYIEEALALYLSLNRDQKEWQRLSDDAFTIDDLRTILTEGPEFLNQGTGCRLRATTYTAQIWLCLYNSTPRDGGLEVSLASALLYQRE